MSKITTLQQFLIKYLSCLIGRHNIISYEIDKKDVKACRYCKYTEYKFFDGWSKIDRTPIIYEYVKRTNN